MGYIVEGACGCNVGKIRKNNEDNFYFDGKCLERENQGSRYLVSIEQPLKNGLMVSVFDGMGGENYGEYASYEAARQFQISERKLADFFISPKKYLLDLANQSNDAVLEVQKEMCTEHVGTTLVALYFFGKYVYSCNLGDSRAYRLRDGEFMQLSEDHVEKRPNMEKKKAPLTQYLGLNTEEMLLEPYITKGKIKRGDMYLLCSDGLTDMLSNFEIVDIMLKSMEAEECVDNLIAAALNNGGRDNVTVIVLMIK